MKINLSNTNIAEISNEEYITKTTDAFTYIEDLMSKEGYKFDEQFGSSYIFQKDNKKISISSTQYTKYYILWKIKKVSLDNLSKNTF